MGGLDVEVVEQADRVVGHVRERVGGTTDAPGDELASGRRRRVGEVRRAAAVAVVEADDMEAAAGEPLAELLGPGDHLEAQPDDEQQGGVARVAERLVAELDPAGGAELLVYGVVDGPCSDAAVVLLDLDHDETLAGEPRLVIGWRDQSA